MARATALAGVLAGMAGLAGCAQDPHPELTAKAQQLLPTEQFAIKVTSRPEQIALGLHREGLSATQQAALAQFVSQWRDDGGGPLTLRAPTDVGDPALARRMQDQTAAYLTHLGVPAERLQLAGYASNHAAGAPLLASYDRFEALGPNCSGAWNNLMATGGNTPSNHYGCAVTANVAAQIANPRDLLAPAVMTPSDASRREVVLGHYRKGEVTSSAKDDQANGKVSETQ